MDGEDYCVMYCPCCHGQTTHKLTLVNDEWVWKCLNCGR